MNNNLLHTLLRIAMLLMVALHVSCGDDARFVESDQSVISENIYVSPEKFNGAIHVFYAPQKNVFLSPNENVKFSAIFTLNKNVLDADQAVNYYQSVLWELNGEKFNIASFRYTFHDPGEYTGTLQVIDNYGDTIYDTVNVFVNTPTHIYLSNPRDKYNQAGAGFNDTLNLKWEIQGLDPWETSTCTVFGSTEKREVWENPLGEATCDEAVNLIGNGSEDILAYLPPYYSETYYWGVVLKVSNEQGISEIDTSEIFSFSTQIPNTKTSVLHIPIVYDNMSIYEFPETKITITNSKGDTIAQNLSYDREDYLTMYLEPQTNVTIHLENILQPEFKAPDFTISIPEQTDIIANTVYFTDRVAPVVWPVSNTKESSSNFKFTVLDLGSGINPNKIQIFKNNVDEIEGNFNDTLLTIPNITDSSYTLTIIVYDKAGNMCTPAYWKVNTIVNEDVFNGNVEKIQVLSGPFSNRREQE